MRNVNDHQTPDPITRVLKPTGQSQLQRTTGLVQEEFPGFWIAPIDDECQRVSKLFGVDWNIQNHYRMSATGWSGGIADVQECVECVFGVTPTDLRIDNVNGMASMASTSFVADEVWICLAQKRDYSIVRGGVVQVVSLGLADMVWHRDPGDFSFDATGDSSSWHTLLRMVVPS